MSFTHNRVVAVLAEDRHDQRLMTELLSNAGYDAGVYGCLSSFSEEAKPPSAMILCHRRSESSPTPGVPDAAMAARRLVVLSDCVAENAVIDALEAGAHHYFNIAESPTILQARLEAALRQHSRPRILELDYEPFRFNIRKRHVRLNGSLINLSPKEYEFAYYLFTNQERIVGNSELMTSVWSLPPSMDSRRIDTAACRVRKKMQLDERTGWCLRRLRRVGYRLYRRDMDIDPTSSVLNTPNIAELT